MNEKVLIASDTLGLTPDYTATPQAGPSTLPIMLLARYRDAALLFAALLLAWTLASHLLPLGANSLLPTPQRTLAALVDSLPELWQGTVSSLLILIPGFSAATVLGVVAGLAAGSSPRLGDAVFPVSRVVAPIPPTVYVPYAIARNRRWQRAWIYHQCSSSSQIR